MIQSKNFKIWLEHNSSYSSNVVSDIVSRMKRADNILSWNNSETYLFFLEKEEKFELLSVSVRSQIRKAVKLYSTFTATGI